MTCGLLPYVELGTDEGAFVTGEEGVVYQLLPSRERPFAPKDNSVFPAGSQLGVPTAGPRRGRCQTCFTFTRPRRTKPV